MICGILNLILEECVSWKKVCWIVILYAQGTGFVLQNKSNLPRVSFFKTQLKFRCLLEALPDGLLHSLPELTTPLPSTVFL